MVWFGSTIFTVNEDSMILSKFLIKSMLLVTACGEKCLQKNLSKLPRAMEYTGIKRYKNTGYKNTGWYKK